MTGIRPTKYTAADLAREDELEPTEAAMMDDDEKAEHCNLERDEEDEDWRPSQGTAYGSSQSMSDDMDEGDCLTITGGAKVAPQGDGDHTMDTSDDDVENEEEEEGDEEELEDEDDDNRFPEDLLRKLAEARDAWFAETYRVAAFLAAVRPFTGLTREELNTAYDIVRKRSRHEP
ncbi:hypothetical protein L226DRAFT_607572 [Lentinus tigrinus ALCF2SS1-7]|uniref:uncharacterized protein n=1 Tax=Lentinus tigrinus ALCF2SS1-7 TaxID=1328758 RepID=UPI001165F44F|nr:hypothetical protein L226DRAFT_607572 [Lentinus tigrinus ALCF2SS1-7]